MTIILAILFAITLTYSVRCHHNNAIARREIITAMKYIQEATDDFNAILAEATAGFDEIAQVAQQEIDDNEQGTG